MSEIVNDGAGGPQPNPNEAPVLPADQVFLPDDPPQWSPVAPRPDLPVAQRPAYIGPGLPESLLWLCGIFAAQIAALLAVLTVLTVTHLVTSGRMPGMQVLEDHMLVVIGAAQLATVLFAFVGVTWRLRPAGLPQLGMHLPSAGHLLLVLLITAPLYLLCTYLKSSILELAPQSGGGVEALLTPLAGAPFPLLLLVIAAAPAFAEELIFRGLIGRGLVTRWGVVGGVALTSALFGIVHMEPAHALAVIPLGIAMHCVYLMTGSLSASMLLHFLNNGLAVCMLKLNQQLPLGVIVPDDSALPPELLTVSATAVTAIFLLLWQTRVRTESLPSITAGGEDRSHWLAIVGSTICTLGFFAVVWRLAVAAM